MVDSDTRFLLAVTKNMSFFIYRIFWDFFLPRKPRTCQSAHGKGPNDVYRHLDHRRPFSFCQLKMLSSTFYAHRILFFLSEPII